MSDEVQKVVSGRGIVKTFKDFWGRDKVKALKGIDIDIPKGTIYGLLGPNGAGKSTLIKLLLGHLYPTEGKIAVFGEDPRNVETKFKIGYLPERSYLYKNLTAEETLRYFGEILNLSREQIDSRTEQLLNMVGLQNARKRLVGEFSHGMTRRMGLAQALLNDPEFIILDEPTAGLDPVGCREVKDLILTLGQRGKTVLLTSHLLADVEDVCDDMMVVFGGLVQDRGRLDDVLADSKKMKLEFPTVDQETLNKMKKLAGEEVKVSSPRQSLENFFLKIVNEGNKNQETSGAQMGSGVADYLKDGASSVKAEPVVEVKAEPVVEVKAEPVVEVKAEPVVEVKAEPVVEVKAEPVVEVKAEPVVEVKAEPVVEIKAEPVVEIKTDSLDALKASAQRPDEVIEKVETDEDDDLDEDFLDSLSLK
jgi:ABC-2 type transport system ATP-binding protein